MPYAGKQLQPRIIAKWGAPHWHTAELVKMVGTTLGESSGYVGAWHDNNDEEGNLLSRDCGLMQININLHQIDDGTQATLMTDSTDPKIYGPIVSNNVKHAYDLYEQPGPNNGLRRWQPWVAYTSGWVTFPEWWVWHQDANHNPIGPWLATGRYIHRAIIGVANYHLLVSKNMSAEQAVNLADTFRKKYAILGTVGIKNGYVQWVDFPPKPKDPPADGIGPRPEPNSGM